MRIVSLLASGTEIVCALGAGRELVGRSHECDNPSWVVHLPRCTQPAFDLAMPSGWIDAEVRRRLKAGEPLYHIDANLIASLKPDLLITQEHCEVCAVTPSDVNRAGCLDQAHVLALQAGSLEGIMGGVRAIGRALGREGAAMQLIQRMNSRMDSIWSELRSRQAPKVVMLEWTDPIFAMGNWGPELVERAQGRLCLGERGVHSSAIAWREVCEADPDWLIIAPCGFNLERTLGEISTLEALPGWFDLGAVRRGRVALADGNTYFNRSGTTIVETVEILAEILHGYPPVHHGRAWIRYGERRGQVLVRMLHDRACAKGAATYTDPITGYEVFTARYLRERSYCCGNGCRHCPYQSALV